MLIQIEKTNTKLLYFASISTGGCQEIQRAEKAAISRNCARPQHRLRPLLGHDHHARFVRRDRGEQQHPGTTNSKSGQKFTEKTHPVAVRRREHRLDAVLSQPCSQQNESRLHQVHLPANQVLHLSGHQHHELSPQRFGGGEQADRTRGETFRDD